MSTTKKLRLGPLPKTESVKLTFACPVSLKADLRPLRRAARAGVWRDGRCHDADPAYAGGVYRWGSRIPAGQGR